MDSDPETNAALVESPSDTPVYQSRLRAKREERLQQRQLQPQYRSDDVSPAPEEDDGASRPSSALHEGTRRPPAAMATSRTTARSTGEDARRRQRGEARRVLIDYDGTVWDAVQANDVVMLHNFFLVEGAAKLVEAHSKTAAEFGRTLLHTAAWWGRLEVVQFLLANGARIDAIDTTATRLTPLMESARRGNTDVCVLLLERGADATLRDVSGDNAFHFAARFHHGECLLRMSTAVSHELLVEAWTAINVRRQSPADYIRSHATIFPMLSRRIGDRVSLHQREPRPSRFSSRSTTYSVTPDTNRTIGVLSEGHDPNDDPPATENSRPPTVGLPTRLSGVDALGIDVSSFAYRSKDSIPSH